jgi:hypothetical protein
MQIRVESVASQVSGSRRTDKDQGRPFSRLLTSVEAAGRTGTMDCRYGGGVPCIWLFCGILEREYGASLGSAVSGIKANACES